MKRREFLFAGGMAVVCADTSAIKASPTKQSVEPNNCLVLRQHDQVFLVTDDPLLIKWSGRSRNEVFVVERDAYNIAKNYVDENKQYLDSLMISESPNTIFYWEEDYHDKIVNQLIKLNPKFSVRQISNALSSLGY